MFQKTILEIFIYMQIYFYKTIVKVPRGRFCPHLVRAVSHRATRIKSSIFSSGGVYLLTWARELQLVFPANRKELRNILALRQRNTADI